MARSHRAAATCHAVSNLPTLERCDVYAEAAKLDLSKIYSDQAITYVWIEILDKAAIAGLTRTVVQTAFNRLPTNSPSRQFLENLLAGKPVIPDAEPRSVDGTPTFLKDTDEVLEPEALLYNDDLTIQIGRVPGLIATLQRLVTLAPAVCKLVVDIHGASQSGTGFRIGPDLLLTNWHVLHNKNDGTPASVVSAEFGYDDDGSGGIIPSSIIPCNVASIVTNKDDDWAVIQANEPLKATWSVIKLSEAAMPSVNAAAYIIQHPGGERKRVGFVRNQVSFFDERVVHYLTDTKMGSSGSPLFDAQRKLIALHHAGGRPQEVVGRAPLKKNEGIRITRIVDGLIGKGISVP